MNGSRKKQIFFLFWCSFVIVTIFYYQNIKDITALVRATVAYDEYGCGCPRDGPPIAGLEDASLCSDWSTARGRNQNVISYTLYGNHNNRIIWKRFYGEVEERIKEANLFYKDWVIRLYHDAKISDTRSKQFVCDLFCKFPNFDPCQVNSLQIPSRWVREIRTEIQKKLLYNNNKNIQIIRSIATFFNPTYSYNKHFDIQTDTNNTDRKLFEEILVPKLWRFIPMGDNYVSMFMSRDVDSYILPREVAAVEEWLHNSTALIHAMRDHPSHNGAILAGMWGGARFRNEKKMTNFLKSMLSYPRSDIWDYDQVLLRTIIWPQVQDDILLHDSYHCQSPYLMAKKKAAPYPTKRNGSMFVSWGSTRSKSELQLITQCPKACRPIEHIDWEFC